MFFATLSRKNPDCDELRMIYQANLSRMNFEPFSAISDSGSIGVARGNGHNEASNPQVGHAMNLQTFVYHVEASEPILQVPTG